MTQNAKQREFESLLAPLLGAAYGTALHLTRNREEAEDLVQEAAVQAFRAFHSFQPGTNFKAWFFRILTRLFFNQYRKKRREPEFADLEDAPELYLYTQTRSAGLHERNTDPATLVLTRMDSEQIGRAIAALPEDYRVVSSLYFMEEFTYQEIAEMVECPLGTVRSRLHRGRKMLQKALWQIAEAQGILADLTSEKDS